MTARLGQLFRYLTVRGGVVTSVETRASPSRWEVLKHCAHQFLVLTCYTTNRNIVLRSISSLLLLSSILSPPVEDNLL